MIRAEAIDDPTRSVEQGSPTRGSPFCSLWDPNGLSIAATIRNAERERELIALFESLAVPPNNRAAPALKRVCRLAGAVPCNGSPASSATIAPRMRRRNSGGIGVCALRRVNSRKALWISNCGNQGEQMAQHQGNALAVVVT
jgi:hypothetical protein